MQKKMRLTGIISQGASRMGTAEFIKAFKVASSFDGKTYTTFRSEGQRKDKVRVTLSAKLHNGAGVLKLEMWGERDKMYTA